VHTFFQPNAGTLHQFIPLRLPSSAFQPLTQLSHHSRRATYDFGAYSFKRILQTYALYAFIHAYLLLSGLNHYAVN